MSRFTKRLAAVTALCILTACADDLPTNPDGDSLAAARLDGSPSASVVGATVVMSNLDSPRDLAFGPEGALYVTESGNPSITGPCATVVRGLNCWSGTGAVSRLWKGRQERVASGLPSVYNAAAFDIIGPNDIDFQGRGNAYVSIGWGGNPAARAQLGPAGAGLGALIRVKPGGDWSVAADLAGFELNNPDGGFIDSNPYGILAEGGRRYVPDAGGNSLLELRANGGLSLVTTLAPFAAPPPFNQSEAVPTEVTRGPDGALYVSLLTGAPFLPGAAGVYRIDGSGSPQLHAGGFKMAIDHAWGPDGSLYVLEFDTFAGFFFGAPGRVTRVWPNGARTVVTSELTSPTGLVVGPDGALYVSNFGTMAAVGQVLRFDP